MELQKFGQISGCYGLKRVRTRHVSSNFLPCWLL